MSDLDWDELCSIALVAYMGNCADQLGDNSSIIRVLPEGALHKGGQSDLFSSVSCFMIRPNRYLTVQ